MTATWLVFTGGCSRWGCFEVDEEREPGKKHHRHSADTSTLPDCVLFHSFVHVTDCRMRVTAARPLFIARDGLVGVVAAVARLDALGVDTLLRRFCTSVVDGVVADGPMELRWNRDGIEKILASPCPVPARWCLLCRASRWLEVGHGNEQGRWLCVVGLQSRSHSWRRSCVTRREANRLWRVSG